MVRDEKVTAEVTELTEREVIAFCDAQHEGNPETADLLVMLEHATMHYFMGREGVIVPWKPPGRSNEVYSRVSTAMWRHVVDVVKSKLLFSVYINARRGAANCGVFGLPNEGDLEH